LIVEGEELGGRCCHHRDDDGSAAHDHYAHQPPWNIALAFAVGTVNIYLSNYAHQPPWNIALAIGFS